MGNPAPPIPTTQMCIRDRKRQKAFWQKLPGFLFPPPVFQRKAEDVYKRQEQDEDVLSYALFPQVATDFFKYRDAQKTKVDAAVADTENGAYPV